MPAVAHPEVDPVWIQNASGIDDTERYAGDRRTGFASNWIRAGSTSLTLASNPTLRCAFSLVLSPTDQYTDPADDIDVATSSVDANRMAYAGGNPVNMVDPEGHRVSYGAGKNGRTMLARVQIGGDGSVWSGGSGSGGSASYRRHSTMSAAQVRAKKVANKEATKARWNARPDVKARKARLAKRQSAALRKERQKKARIGVTFAAQVALGSGGASMVRHGRSVMKTPVRDPVNNMGKVAVGTKLIAVGGIPRTPE